MKYIIPDIFKLYDHLEKNMRKFYSNGVSNKKYGAITGVTARKDRKEAFYVGMKDYKHLLDFSRCFFLAFLEKIVTLWSQLGRDLTWLDKF